MSCALYSVGHLLSHRKLTLLFVKQHGLPVMLNIASMPMIARSNSVSAPYIALMSLYCVSVSLVEDDTCTLQQSIAMSLFGLASSTGACNSVQSFSLAIPLHSGCCLCLAATMEAIHRDPDVSWTDVIAASLALFRSDDEGVWTDMSHFFSLGFTYRKFFHAFQSSSHGLALLVARALPSAVSSCRADLRAAEVSLQPDAAPPTDIFLQPLASVGWTMDELSTFYLELKTAQASLLPLRQFARYFTCCQLCA